MPIKIPSGLPARAILDSERIFALEQPDAERQRVRPLKLVILNLMPKKIETETQLLRLISKSPLQVEIDFMTTSTHAATHVSADHLVKFYESLDAFADNYYDGLVITGAPVEHLDFDQVDYWDEFNQILDWASSHVFSTLYLCWGAMGALYSRYGVRKHLLDTKIFGVFPQYLQDEYCFLTNGFDEIILQPHSRLAGVDEDDVARNPDLQVLTWGPESGPGLIATRDFSEVFALGHWEYGKYTLAEEYQRDITKGLTNVPFPYNYFPNDDPTKEPLFSWRAHANLLWRNWLNWVYQTTPYDLSEVPTLRAEKRLGTDRSIRHSPGSPREDGFQPFLGKGYGVTRSK
ncbi:homoserine O-succinyltransferase [Bifidobacterium mongoliense]|jgi:homoserine O-succinyltransferase|uniref:homoserine O-succinyltransferase n=1 Tax=Bifidobacterium mongoliense TaxID=518643 RepID=UPI00264A054D|nr:homoserine O-succinyltransferase [Bifidobacterium mongoliense]MDN5633574.1 homoserine O-succinyltransferase [Bifidobacterium mongoliense]MDN5979684.1 homoserine O-succinyltransferase [Bifidobacterium mongoliense]MDN6025716.1 homoserine O-succinyltransferase [Bifidobacterium mongoliense]MDN6051698.1 homoserine O-succinyltransferase [Bifidobacterium mongoliense]MDN6719896.1 homoserine O-succinyltransferase [Bifidobacterium mongoliense]